MKRHLSGVYYYPFSSRTGIIHHRSQDMSVTVNSRTGGDCHSEARAQEYAIAAVWTHSTYRSLETGHPEVKSTGSAGAPLGR